MSRAEFGTRGRIARFSLWTLCCLALMVTGSGRYAAPPIAWDQEVDRMALATADQLIAYYRGDRIKIYVLPFRDAVDESDPVGLRVADRIEGRLFFSDRVEVIERYAFPELLGELKISSLFNWDPKLGPAAMAKIAKELKVDALVTGRVVEKSNNFIVEARLLDPKTNAILSRGRSSLVKSGGWRATPGAYLPLAPETWPNDRPLPLPRARQARRSQPELPRDLLTGRWVRVGDAYAGAVIRIYRVRDCYFGTLLDAGPGLARWGFQPGLKWKYLRPLGGNVYRGLSLSRGGKRGAFFSDMTLRVDPDGANLIVELQVADGADIQGRVQTWNRLVP